MTRIIFTGSPRRGGLAASIERFYPNTFFASKSNGYDLTIDNDYNKFKEIVKNYNVFINHSHIELGNQERFLKDVFDIWSKNNIQGHIFTIGSILELGEWQSLDPVTAKEKVSARETSLKLNCEKIKTTYLITSGFNRFGPEEDIKIDPDDIVKFIKLILESDIDIPLIYVEKTNDERLKKWRSLNNLSF